MNIAAAFEEVARCRPGLAAVVEDGQAIDYATLRQAVRHAAAAFTAAGWTAGTRVGVALPSPTAMQLAAMLALARIGVVQLPLPAGEPAALHDDTLDRFGVRALVAWRPDPPPGCTVVRPDPAWLAGAAQLTDRSPEATAAGGDAPWTIAQSSGTTGRRKSFFVTHAMEQARIASQPAVALPRPGEACLSLIPFDTRSGQSAALRCLSQGATIVARPASTQPDAVFAAIRQAGVTLVIATPSQLVGLAEALPATGGPWFPQLRFLRANSGALPAGLLEMVRQRLTPHFYIDYGTNEGGTLALATPDDLARRPGTVGRALHGVEIDILADGDDAADGGEVRVRGPGVCRGYIDDEAASRHHFRDGWFHPGDRARRDGDGLIHLLERTGDRISFAGIKISLDEIATVARAHPDVADAAAFALPSPRYESVPALAVVARSGGPIVGLGRHCQERLGARAPRHFMLLEALPRTATGKIDGHRLIAILEAHLARRAGGEPEGRAAAEPPPGPAVSPRR